MKVLPLWLLMVSVFILFVSVFWLGVATYYWIKGRSFVYSRGVNGFSNQILDLKCPTGKIISINQVKPPILSCADVSSNGQPKCDPFSTSGLFDPSNTQNVLGELRSECEGKSQCSYKVPRLSGVCGNSCSVSQLTGTYYCK